MSRVSYIDTMSRALVLCALVLGIATAQSDYGSIGGFAKDPSGAVVPKAKVVITNEATGEAHPVITNDSGQNLYITLLGLSSDRSIGVIFPSKADAEAGFEVKAHSTKRLPAIRATIPGCVKVSRDVLIIFASTEPINFFPYVQSGFCDATRTLSDASLPTRGFVTSPGSWASRRLVVEIQP